MSSNIMREGSVPQLTRISLQYNIRFVNVNSESACRQATEFGFSLPPYT